MPQKSRRQRGRQPQVRKAPGPGRQQTTTSTKSAAAVPPAAAASTGTAVAQKSIRHPYIAAELKTIGILAIVMFAVLIVLKLVLN
jgi:hypothetical protein